MDKISFFFCGYSVYWSSVLLFVGVSVAVLLFLSLYLGRNGKMSAALPVVPVAVLLSFFFARLIHWYCFSESYSGFAAAMADYSQGGFALVGAFVGCVLAVVLLTALKRVPDPVRMLDCMCLAGGAGIAIGRLSAFFSTADRGWIMENIQTLPLAASVVNVVSKATEYRFATFMLQALVTGLLTLVLAYFYLKPKEKKWRDGEVSLIFLLCYCTAQILLDSTRYDSMYFRSNGFVSVVQVLGAVVIVSISVIFSIRLVKSHGFHKIYILYWLLMLALLGCAGYMEYYVQRHGNQTTLSYSIMGVCLCAYVVLVLGIWATAGKKPAVFANTQLPHWVTHFDDQEVF